MRYYEITEAMSGEPLPWKWVERSSITWTAEFKINDVVYSVNFECSGTTTDFELNFLAGRGENDRTFEKTGTGNAFAVYSTVLAIVKRFMSLKQVDGLEIVSDTTERSRHQVNQRLARKIAQMGGFEVSDDGETIHLARETDAEQQAA